jgi:hypothetical protein
MSRARDTAGIIQYNKITVDSNNAVGIGSSIPDCKLDINGGLRVVGVSTFEDSVLVPYDKKLNFGSSANQEGQLYATTDYFYINSSATTGMYIQGNGFVNIRSDGGEDMFRGTENGSVQLYYNDAEKFQTTGGGVDITGVATATSFSGSGSGLSSLNASQLSSGTIPDARFPATLPSASGANLTSLNASNLGSGTIPDARFPATLPSASGANLTNLPSSQLTGALPALDGSALTNLNIPATFDWRDGSLF